MEYGRGSLSLKETGELIQAYHANGANEASNEADVLPDLSFLARFYGNVLHLNDDELNHEKMICVPLFENPDLLKNIDPSKAIRGFDS